MKLCTSCQHFVNPDGGLRVREYAKCGAPQNAQPANMVDGTTPPMYVFCASMREATEYSLNNKFVPTCGPNAIWHVEVNV